MLLRRLQQHNHTRAFLFTILTLASFSFYHTHTRAFLCTIAQQNSKSCFYVCLRNYGKIVIHPPCLTHATEHFVGTFTIRVSDLNWRSTVMGMGAVASL